MKITKLKCDLCNAATQVNTKNIDGYNCNECNGPMIPIKEDIADAK